jgi:hypothetical protein
MPGGAMNFLMPYLNWIKAAIVIALLAGLATLIWRAGANSVQVDWNKANADRANAEKAAVLARVSENLEIFRRQELDNQKITKAHDDELTKIRADLSRSERMRIASALCGGPTGTAQAASAGGSDGADPAGRVLSAEMDGAVKSLILEMEQVAATGRACQSFARNIPN